MQNDNRYEETTLEEVKKQINDLNIALESLNRNLELCVGTESIIGFVKEVGGRFWSNITNISKAFIKFCTAPFASPLLPEVKEYEKNKGKLQRVSNNNDNWSLLVSSNVKIPYISGCNLPLIEIGRVLDELNKDCFEIVGKAVSETNYIISKGLSDKDFRTSKRPYDTKDILKKAEKYTENVDKANEYLIKSDLHEDNQIIGSVIYYPREVVELDKYTSNITKTLDIKRLEQINSDVKSIGMIAKELADLIDNHRYDKNKKDEYPSKEFVNLIKETLYTSGRAVTAISTQFYLTTQLFRVYNFFNRNVDKLIDEAKKDKDK